MQLVHGSASKRNRVGADTQVVSCQCYPVVIVEQLTVFYISVDMKLSTHLHGYFNVASHASKSSDNHYEPGKLCRLTAGVLYISENSKANS